MAPRRGAIGYDAEEVGPTTAPHSTPLWCSRCIRWFPLWASFCAAFFISFFQLYWDGNGAYQGDWKFCNVVRLVGEAVVDGGDGEDTATISIEQGLGPTCFERSDVPWVQIPYSDEQGRLFWWASTVAWIGMTSTALSPFMFWWPIPTKEQLEQCNEAGATLSHRLSSLLLTLYTAGGLFPALSVVAMFVSTPCRAGDGTILQLQSEQPDEYEWYLRQIGTGIETLELTNEQSATCSLGSDAWPILAGSCLMLLSAAHVWYTDFYLPPCSVQSNAPFPPFRQRCGHTIPPLLAFAACYITVFWNRSSIVTQRGAYVSKMSYSTEGEGHMYIDPNVQYVQSVGLSGFVLDRLDGSTFGQDPGADHWPMLVRRYSSEQRAMGGPWLHVAHGSANAALYFEAAALLYSCKAVAAQSLWHYLFAGILCLFSSVCCAMVFTILKSPFCGPFLIELQNEPLSPLPGGWRLPYVLVGTRAILHEDADGVTCEFTSMKTIILLMSTVTLWFGTALLFFCKAAMTKRTLLQMQVPSPSYEMVTNSGDKGSPLSGIDKGIGVGEDATVVTECESVVHMNLYEID
ncbi:hypothetical protein ACHAXT_001727 [Thalassiosira profunda]